MHAARRPGQETGAGREPYRRPLVSSSQVEISTEQITLKDRPWERGSKRMKVKIVPLGREAPQKERMTQQLGPGPSSDEYLLAYGPGSGMEPAASLTQPSFVSAAGYGPDSRNQSLGVIPQAMANVVVQDQLQLYDTRQHEPATSAEALARGLQGLGAAQQVAQAFPGAQRYSQQ